MPLTHVQPIRYDEAQYKGLAKAAQKFRVTGRQKAQREINRLFLAYFGLINDPIAASTMQGMIMSRERRRNAP